MEDWNTLVTDCIVISCCCQCVVVEIFIFILLKLPYKMVQKTKRYAKKKLKRRKRAKTMMQSPTGLDRGKYFSQFPEDGLGTDEFHGCGDCMEEVEKVMEELLHDGEFAFGSFWGREDSESLTNIVSRQEFHCHVVQFGLVEMASCT